MSQQDLFSNHTVAGKHDNSKAAAKRAFLASGSQRLRVFECLASTTAGLTDKQIQKRLGLDGSSQRPRRQELQKKNLIAESGRKHEGSAVWVLTERGWAVHRGEEEVAA